MKYWKHIAVALFFIIHTKSWSNDALDLSVIYINDIATVITGGKSSGMMMMGRGSLKVVLNTNNIGLWPDGKLNIMGNVTHGGNFSEQKIGDYQVASNIDAGDHIYIHELFYEQQISDVTLKLGVQDLNVDFLVSNVSAPFLNSSFGVPSVISHGIPAPIYPLTAMGAVAEIKFADNFSFKASIFDGLPISFENNPYNTNWHINSKHGFQFFNEVGYFDKIFEDKNSTLKIGYYHHTGINDPESEYFEAYTRKNGVYAIIDQEILKGDQLIASTFLQVTYSPSKKQTDNNLYIGHGWTIDNLFGSLINNKIGFALAYSKFNTQDYNYELALETFFRCKVFNKMYLQPDLQYIINPGGNISGKINNALVGFVRFILEN